MRVILHADDCGMAPGFNRAAERAAKSGCLTSASVCSNGAAADEAAAVLRAQPALGVGLHVNVVEGYSRRKIGKTDILCEPDGLYRLGFVALRRGLRGSEAKSVLAALEVEVRQQLEWLLDRGVQVDHLDSHRHVHCLPPVFALFCRLAAEYELPAVRLVDEPWLGWHAAGWYAVNILKHRLLNGFAEQNRRSAKAHGVLTNDRFLGVLFSGHQSVASIRRGLARCGESGLVQVALHPGQPLGLDPPVEAPGVQSYLTQPGRFCEFEALMDPALRVLLEESACELVSFKNCRRGGG